MKIIKIISEYKRIKGKKAIDNTYTPPTYPKKGYKRVEAIVELGGARFTKHIDIKR